MFLSLFLFSFVSAIDTFENGSEMSINIICLNDGYCSNNSYCNINVLDPSSNQVVTNENMTNLISYHNYTLTPTGIGLYSVNGYCEDGVYSEEVKYEFEVTKFGDTLNDYDASIRIILLLIPIGLFFFIFYLNKKIDYKRWYEGILKKYEKKI